MRNFVADFEAHGVEAIEALRNKSPEKYSEIAARLIAAIEPKPQGLESCKSKEEMGMKLLESVGVPPEAITEPMTEAAIAANDDFVARLLDEIAQAAGYGEDLH